MKRKYYYIGLLIIIIVTIALLPAEAILSVIRINKLGPLNKRTIVIDPGHGGIDGGTNIGHILEKDINLAVGLRLKEILIKKGATVLMTREVDDSLDDHIPNNGSRHREDLKARVKIVNDSDPHMLVSIHVNHIKNERKLGPIVFYHTNSEDGKFLAQHMQEYLNDISTYKKMDIKAKHDATSGDYYLLGYTSCPGIIVEMGFISNEVDRKLLLDSDHQIEMAEQISKGIIYYFRKTDKDKDNGTIKTSE